MALLTRYGTQWGAIPMTAGKVIFVAKMPSTGYAVYDVQSAESAMPSAFKGMSESAGTLFATSCRIVSCESSPLRLHVGRQATWVDTGDALPPEANAVIMAEHVQDLGDGLLEILASVAPWQHVRPMGEDLVATELVLPENHALGAVDLGAIVAAGHTCVSVRRRPRVAILPTGSELVEPGALMPPGAIVDFNSVVLAAQVREWGGEPTRLSITPDDRALIRDRAGRFQLVNLVFFNQRRASTLP